MPRLVQGLKTSISQIFDEKIESVDRIASRISSAYQSYAQGAQGPLGDPTILKGVENRGFESALLQLMKSQAPAPVASGLLVQAITAFWLAPPVLTSTGGLCVSIVPAGAQAKMVSSRADNANAAAANLANSLHLMTNTVFVTYPTPVPPRPPGFLL